MSWLDDVSRVKMRFTSVFSKNRNPARQTSYWASKSVSVAR